MPKDVEKTRERIRNIIPSKKNDLYSSNMYWSQKAFNICDILIEELSEPGETIFDPFMGSGVTILEALRKSYKRKAIGCEINEAPLIIVKTLLKNYDLNAYHNESKKLIDRIKLLKKYYECICPQCGETGYLNKTIFDMNNRFDTPKIKSISLTCDKCKKVEKKESFDDDLKKMTAAYDISHIATDIMIEDSKLAVYKNETIDQIFTNRNFKVLDEILTILDENLKYKELYKYIIMSVLHLCKITDTHSNSQWPLWIPKTNCVEKNIIDIICKKIKKFEKTIEYIHKEYDDEKNYVLLNKASQNITDNDIQDGSIHLIITDPPYLGQVAYSEYMQLYKPFLGYRFNIEDEIIVTSTPDRKISEDEYFSLLDKVFSICDKKMVDGGYFCMYFHDSNLSVWDRLLKIMSNNHFRYLSQEHIKKTNTLKNIISPKKSLSGDAILFFVKEKFEYKEDTPKESIEEIEYNLIKQILSMIKNRGPLTTPELYDGGLIEYLVYNGWLGSIATKYKTLVDIFEKYLSWNSYTNCWESKNSHV